jgi:hypothetical protein
MRAGDTEPRGLGLTLAEIRWLAGNCPDENWQLTGPCSPGRPEVQIAQLGKTRHRIGAFAAAHRHALAGQPDAEIWSSTADPCTSCS